MGSQGFRNISGNPFVYQEDVRSSAFGLDAAAQKWKIVVSATTGALPTGTAQFTIDPATNGDVTIDPNGSGNLVVTSGNVSLTAGNLVLPSVGANLFWSVDATQRGQVFINKMITAAGYPAHKFLHSTGVSTGGYDTCVYVGHGAGESVGNTTQGNAFVGYNAAPALANSGAFTGGYNCGIGSVMLNASSAQFNFCAGSGTANAMTSGIQNTILSAYGAYRLTTGNYNCILGTTSQLIASDVRYWGAGYNLTGSESNNVLIQASGTTGVSNRLQIGDATGTGVGQLSTAYIHGIYGVTPGGTQNIALIDSNGQLGSTATLSPALGGKMTWTEVTGTSQTAAVNNGYITNNVALVTVTLPSTAAVGQIIRIGGKGAGLWKLAQNSGQVIHFGSVDTTTGTGGYLAATVKYDTVEVICITANTDWLVLSSVGTITVV